MIFQRCQKALLWSKGLTLCLLRRPKLTWKKLTEKDCCEWKLITVDHKEIRCEICCACSWSKDRICAVRSAMHAAGLRTEYVLACCCIPHFLKFDMHHDHVLKKLNLDISPEL